MSHRIKITLPGYQIFETNINPLANQKVEIKTDLIRNGSPLADPWSIPRQDPRRHSVEVQPTAPQRARHHDNVQRQQQSRHFGFAERRR
jgi:hypothetical protein